jgi:ribosomal protein S27AE
MALFASARSAPARKFSPDLPTFDLKTRPANECAQCGEAIFMPEWSEWLNPACARHVWQCEACGYAFETTVKFAAA